MSTDITFKPPRRGPSEALKARIDRLRRLKRLCAGAVTKPQHAHHVCSQTAQFVTTFVDPGSETKVERFCSQHQREIIRSGWQILNVIKLQPLGRAPRDKGAGN